MVIFEDTRNQAGKHRNIEKYCKEKGIEIIRQALCVGDYMISNRGEICVDTKQDVAELAGNIFQDHERFREECERAQRCGIQLVVLVEEVLPGGLLENWRSPLGRDGRPRHRFDPATLKKAMLTMQEKYGVKFRFCDGRSTGKVLMEYLQGERE
jgi:ERCC4-type nuclease